MLSVPCNMNLLVDQGNTNLKAAISDGKNVVSFWNEGTEEAFVEWFTPFGIKKAIISNVGKETARLESLLVGVENKIKLSSNLILPFKNTYESKDTQGSDRIAAIAGAIEKLGRGPLMTIVCGTCIIYDVIDQNGDYAGGSISPGMRMRFRSLNEFTYKLPLVKEVTYLDLEGKNTLESIQSGVYKGICYEIEGFIRAYRKKYPQLQVILSGGDARFFETTIKESIFVVPELQFLGLNRILNDNV